MIYEKILILLLFFAQLKSAQATLSDPQKLIIENWYKNNWQWKEVKQEEQLWWKKQIVTSKNAIDNFFELIPFEKPTEKQLVWYKERFEEAIAKKQFSGSLKEFYVKEYKNRQSDCPIEVRVKILKLVLIDYEIKILGKKSINIIGNEQLIMPPNLNNTELVKSTLLGFDSYLYGNEILHSFINKEKNFDKVLPQINLWNNLEGQGRLDDDFRGAHTCFTWLANKYLLADGINKYDNMLCVGCDEQNDCYINIFNIPEMKPNTQERTRALYSHTITKFTPTAVALHYWSNRIFIVGQEEGENKNVAYFGELLQLFDEIDGFYLHIDSLVKQELSFGLDKVTWRTKNNLIGHTKQTGEIRFLTIDQNNNIAFDLITIKNYANTPLVVKNIAVNTINPKEIIFIDQHGNCYLKILSSVVGKAFKKIGHLDGEDNNLYNQLWFHCNKVCYQYSSEAQLSYQNKPIWEILEINNSFFTKKIEDVAEDQKFSYKKYFLTNIWKYPQLSVSLSIIFGYIAFKLFTAISAHYPLYLYNTDNKS